MPVSAECGIAPPDVYRMVEEELGTVAGLRILDMPCASGQFARRLAWRGADCIGVDWVKPQHYARALRADMNRALPFRDGTFDRVLCLEGIEHTQNPFQLAREMHRVLRPGGLVMLSTPNIHNLRSRVKFLLRGTLYWFDSREVTGVGHISVMPLFILRHLLAEAGFRDVRVKTNGTVRPWLPGWVAAALRTIMPVPQAGDADLNSLPVLNGEGFVVFARKEAAASATGPWQGAAA